MTSAVTFLNFPPMPEIPEPLAGRSVIAVRVATAVTISRRRARSCWRLGASSASPSWTPSGSCLYEMMDMISMDPVDPLGAYGHAEMLRDLSPDTARHS